MYRVTGPDPGPEPLGEILARLVVARGWGRRQARLQVERAWAEAIGKEQESRTRVLSLRRGVLEIEVDSPILLQELASFQRRTLLAKLRRSLPNHALTDLRFRAGTW